MSTNRLFVLSVVIALVAAVVLTAQAAVAPAITLPGADRSFSETEKEALHEYELGERYGELPGYIEGFSPEQIQREFELGERYGETSHAIAGFSGEQIQREYWLGERYGETPQQYAQKQALREYWLGERYGQIP